MPLGTVPTFGQPASADRSPRTGEGARHVTPCGAGTGRGADLDARVFGSGGYYDHRSVLRWLHLDEPGLTTLVSQYVVVALPACDGSLVYPAWAFQPDGTPVPFLPDIVRVLAHGTDDPWKWALWLTAAREDGSSAIDTLTAGGDPRPIRDHAIRDAGRRTT